MQTCAFDIVNSWTEKKSAKLVSMTRKTYIVGGIKESGKFSQIYLDKYRRHKIDIKKTASITTGCS